MLVSVLTDNQYQVVLAMLTFLQGTGVPQSLMRNGSAFWSAKVKTYQWFRLYSYSNPLFADSALCS